MRVIGHLVARALKQIKQSHIVIHVYADYGANYWENLKSTHLVFRLNIECFYLETITYFYQVHDGDVLLIAA